MKFNELIFNPKSKYIAITFIISAIGFLKSLILLKIFDINTLGIITLSQTITITISLLQIGTIAGGYRLFSYKENYALKPVNAAVFIFFFIVTGALLILAGIAKIFFVIELSTVMLFWFIIIGLVSLYSNWVVCKLLGQKNIVLLNNAQFIAAIISIAITFTAKWYGLTAALISITMQPTILILITYLKMPEIRPELRLRGFKKVISKIISLGFIPYLTTALTYFNSQLGRWLIVFTMGTTVLGQTFLVSLFLSLVSVFPSAINNLFFPSIIEKFEKNMKSELAITLKRHSLILLLYFCVVTVGTLLFVKTLVVLFLPKHQPYVSLIYAIMPSVVILNISSPILAFFNAAKKFKQIFYGSIISVIAYVLLLLLYLLLLKPRLIDFYIIESMSATIAFIYNFYYYFKLHKK